MTKKVQSSAYKVQSKNKILDSVKVGKFSPIVAEWCGGKHETRHRFANFVPQKMAANTRTATVVA
jgi:hypothetical protein